MISSRDQRRIYLLPGRPDQTRNPGLQDISTMVNKTSKTARCADNPDRSCTYLVLRATSDEHYVQLKPALEFPRGGAASGSGSDQHLDKHWPGGAIIKMTLERATPKGKVGGGEANGKTNVGPCWRSFIQSELSRGSHKSPDHVRNAKSGNITPV